MGYCGVAGVLRPFLETRMPLGRLWETSDTLELLSRLRSPVAEARSSSPRRRSRFDRGESEAGNREMMHYGYYFQLLQNAVINLIAYQQGFHQTFK
jgi:hypothetical protein